MALVGENFNNRRLRSSNITVVVSIALVLFLIGITGLILINTSNYFNYLKEKYVVEAFLNDFVDKKDSAQVLQMQLDFKDSLMQKKFVKDVTYISKEEAYQFAKTDLGPDKINMVDRNIFPASVQIAIRSEYVDHKKVDSISKILGKNPIVNEVKKDDQLMVEVYENLNTILLWISVAALMFLFIAIILINNSIRLRIFSKRFIIKTMQLVGANKTFIILPFLKQALWLGLIGAGIALILISAVWYYFSTIIDLPFMQEYNKFFLLAFGVLFLGAAITVISTFIATYKFLKLRTDDLHYS